MNWLRKCKFKFFEKLFVRVIEVGKLSTLFEVWYWSIAALFDTLDHVLINPCNSLWKMLLTEEICSRTFSLDNHVFLKTLSILWLGVTCLNLCHSLSGDHWSYDFWLAPLNYNRRQHVLIRLRLRISVTITQRHGILTN